MSLESYLDEVMDTLLWEHNPYLAVAVSGGVDSMALALLVQRWATHRQGRISALVVDHGLRPESTDEAHQTVSWLAQHGIEGQVLSLALATSPHAVQERARDARYAALSEWCRQHEVLHLLVGHHQGDQAETMLFRLTRHSGLSGLAAMPLVREQHGIRLIRPLLGVSKTMLEGYLRERNQSWVHDPSNDQTRFTRIQFRQMLAQCSVDTNARVAKIARGLGRWRADHETQLYHALCRFVTSFGDGTVQVHQRVATLPHRLQSEIWQAVLDSVGNHATPPRGAAIERLMEILSHQSHYALHGCNMMLDRQRSCWIVSKSQTNPSACLLEDTAVDTYIRNMTQYVSENHEKASIPYPKPLAPAPFSAMNEFL